MMHVQNLALMQEWGNPQIDEAEHQAWVSLAIFPMLILSLHSMGLVPLCKCSKDFNFTHVVLFVASQMELVQDPSIQ